MVTKFMLNTVLQHVGLSWIIDSNQQLEYDMDQNNLDWSKNVSWYNTSICAKLHDQRLEIYEKCKN